MKRQGVLIAGPSWVGDMVMAQALCKLIKRQSDDSIDMLAPAWSLPVIARMPEIREGIALDARHGELALVARRRLGRELQKKRYRKAIILPRSFKAALVPWFANIPRRTGYRGEWRYGLLNDVRRLDRVALDQTVKRFVALGSEDTSLPEEIPQPVLSINAARQEILARELGLETGRPSIALMPGAEYGPAKSWPHEHFAGLARRLAASGFVVWVLGSQKDDQIGSAIAADSPALNLCGRTRLEDAIDLLGLCQHAVSNDSGLLHVAAAVGCHVHALYGSSSPAFTPPLTERREIHYLGLECSPCFKRECPLGHMKCLNDILPESVANRIEMTIKTE